MNSPLLRPIPENAPPDDYLLARVRYRRSRLDLSGLSDPWPGRAVEEGLHESFAWLFGRLRPRAGKFLQPFLELHAGRTLIQALRLQRAEKPEALRHLLRGSLLREELCQSLLAAEDSDRFVTAMEKHLGSRCRELRRLTAVHADQGPGGVEERIAAGLLSRALRTARTSAMTLLVRRFIDLRNLTAIAKYWRWQVARRPDLVGGGDIGHERLHRVWAARDEAGLEQLAERLAGTAGKQLRDARAIETAVYLRLTLDLQRQGRDPLGGAVLLDYLWRCRMAARNRTLFQALEQDNEKLLDDVMVVP